MHSSDINTANTNISSPRMQVLFLNAPSKTGEVYMKEVGRCGRRAIAGEVWPQTGLAYLAAMVEREGHVARIIDAMAEPISVAGLIEECRAWGPDIIIANSATPTIKNDSEVLGELAQATGALCGFSGPHVSALPEETLRGAPWAAFGLINEAEETVAELVRGMGAGLRRTRTETRTETRTGARTETQTGIQMVPEAFLGRVFLQGIRGIAWRDGQTDEIIVNPERALTGDIDGFPFPARHLLPNAAYRMPFFQNHPFATVIPSRGCPWPCTFCRAGRVWGRKIRTRSVENVLEEIRGLERDFGIRHLVFMTDSLTLNRKWAVELFEGLLRLPKPPVWICNSRVDVVDAEMLRLMKRAGCRQVAYGLESGSQAVLDACRKGITLEQNERAIRLTREAKLLSMAYFVLGLPGETAETVRESVRFAIRVNPDYVNFHIATPFPGTELYDEAKAKGWLRSDDWNEYEEEGSSVMQAGELTTGELREAQKRAMRAFYLRPRRLVEELARLRSWGEFSAKLRAGVKVLTMLGKG